MTDTESITRSAEIQSDGAMSHLVANKPFVDPPHDKLPSSTINHTTVIEATELITRQLPNLYPPEAEELRRVTMGEINRNKLNGGTIGRLERGLVELGNMLGTGPISDHQQIDANNTGPKLISLSQATNSIESFKLKLLQKEIQKIRTAYRASFGDPRQQSYPRTVFDILEDKEDDALIKGLDAIDAILSPLQDQPSLRASAFDQLKSLLTESIHDGKIPTDFQEEGNTQTYTITVSVSLTGQGKRKAKKALHQTIDAIDHTYQDLHTKISQELYKRVFPPAIKQVPKDIDIVRFKQELKQQQQTRKQVLDRRDLELSFRAVNLEESIRDLQQKMHTWQRAGADLTPLIKLRNDKQQERNFLIIREEVNNQSQLYHEELSISNALVIAQAELKILIHQKQERDSKSDQNNQDKKQSNIKSADLTMQIEAKKKEIEDMHQQITIYQTAIQTLSIRADARIIHRSLAYVRSRLAQLNGYSMLYADSMQESTAVRGVITQAQGDYHQKLQKTNELQEELDMLQKKKEDITKEDKEYDAKIREHHNNESLAMHMFTELTSERDQAARTLDILKQEEVDLRQKEMGLQMQFDTQMGEIKKSIEKIHTQTSNLGGSHTYPHSKIINALYLNDIDQTLNYIKLQPKKTSSIADADDAIVKSLTQATDDILTGLQNSNIPQAQVSEIRSLAPTQAKKMIQIFEEQYHGAIMSLDKLTLLHQELETIQVLSPYQGDLFINGLTKLNVKVARELAKHQGDLGLNGLTTLSEEVAGALAKHQGNLWLNGLTTLDAKVARELIKHKGGLWLVQVHPSDEVATILAGYTGGELKLNIPAQAKVDHIKHKIPEAQNNIGNSASIATIDTKDGTSTTDQIIKGLRNASISPIEVSEIKTLTCKQAHKLVRIFQKKYNGAVLNLDQLTTLDGEVARELIKHKGNLWLAQVCPSDEVATILAGYTGGELKLNIPAQAKVDHIKQKIQEAQKNTGNSASIATIDNIIGQNLTPSKDPIKKWLQDNKIFVQKTSEIRNLTSQQASELIQVFGERHKGAILNISGLTTLDLETARELVKHQGGLWLHGLTKLDVKVAKKLAEHQGDLGLNGLTTLDEEVAKKLIKHKGNLWLAQVYPSDEVATILAGYTGGELKLNIQAQAKVDNIKQKIQTAK